MALLNRLFSSKKKNHRQGYISYIKNEYESWKPFNFSKEQVRVLLFRECDWRGRKLLFDSKAVQKVSLESQPCKLKFGQRQKNENKKTESYVEVTNGYGYQYMRPNSDVTMLGEMIFGSVAMSFQGSVSKVHSMKSPSRLMCTKVFHSPGTGARSRGASDRSLEDSCGSSVNSMTEYITSLGSCNNSRQASVGSGPLDIELRSKHQFNSLEVDSGFCGDASLQSASSVGSTCGFGTYKSSPDSRRSSGSFLTSHTSCHSGGSLASLQRRWLRNMSTSLELGSSWSLRNSVTNVDDDVTMQSTRRTKLGLAVVITLTPEEENEMNLFLFEHMPVIDGMIERLQSSVEHAYLHKEMFVHLMVEGCQEMEQWLVDIFCAPRLTCPVWLGLTSGMNHLNSSLSYNFLHDLCQLIAAIDTKATNFFVSTLLTAVLTHHLGWVATILPGKMPPQFITKKPCTGQLLDALSKSHPYNPLWAQLGELYGALGHPTKISKTIVTSGVKKVELLNKILSSLTYFIRCSEVEKRVVSDKEIDPSSSGSNATLISEEPHSPFSRTFLSSHDVMEVFDNRVDPGVEIGRELRGETCADKHDKSLLSPSSISIVSNTSTLTHSSVKSVSENDLSNQVPQLGGMKRSMSYVKKLDCTATNECSQTNHGSGRLYPSLADLQLVEDETRECESLFEPDNISTKVNKLMRVPTNAILYHLQQEQDGEEELQFQPKRIESERQRSTPLSRTTKWAERERGVLPLSSSPKMSEKISERESDVIFVLGDNEKLVGLRQSGKSECDSGNRLESCEKHLGFDKSSVSSLNSTPVVDKHSLVRAANKNSSPHILISDHCKGKLNLCLNGKLGDNKVPDGEHCLGNNNCRIVTVRPSVIELEDECGGVKTDLSINPKPGNPVTRSLSLSCPQTSDKTSKNASSLCRRNSDCVCDSSRYLKDYHSVRFHFQRCEGVLMNYIEGREQKKSVVHVDKKSDKVTEARGNFSLAACEKCNNVNRESCSDSGVGEDNAMFEVCSNLSDEESLFSCEKSRRKEEDMTPMQPLVSEMLEELSVPRCTSHAKQMCGFAASLMGGSSDHYIPDMVLQGCTQLHKGWEACLRRDLALTAHHPLLDQEVSEAVCIIANIETWEVQLVSSHTYVVDKPGTLGVRVGMSRLVANMLESLLYLWKLKTSPEHCLLHLESKLRELFLRSQALAELLLTTEFCDMELLTTSLDLDANDVPLLLAIAATHTPQVAERYGLSFR